MLGINSSEITPTTLPTPLTLYEKLIASGESVVDLYNTLTLLVSAIFNSRDRRSSNGPRHGPFSSLEKSMGTLSASPTTEPTVRRDSVGSVVKQTIVPVPGEEREGRRIKRSSKHSAQLSRFGSIVIDDQGRVPYSKTPPYIQILFSPS